MTITGGRRRPLTVRKREWCSVVGAVRPDLPAVACWKARDGKTHTACTHQMLLRPQCCELCLPSSSKVPAAVPLAPSRHTSTPRHDLPCGAPRRTVAPAMPRQPHMTWVALVAAVLVLLLGAVDSKPQYWYVTSLGYFYAAPACTAHPEKSYGGAPWFSNHGSPVQDRCAAVLRCLGLMSCRSEPHTCHGGCVQPGGPTCMAIPGSMMHSYVCMHAVRGRCIPQAHRMVGWRPS